MVTGRLDRDRRIRTRAPPDLAVNEHGNAEHRGTPSSTFVGGENCEALAHRMTRSGASADSTFGWRVRRSGSAQAASDEAKNEYRALDIQ